MSNNTDDLTLWEEYQLALPLLPESLQHQSQVFTRDHIGTIEKPSPQADYMFTPSLDFLQKDVPDHYALSYWGHGINSFGLNFRYAYGNVAALVQVGFGGAYSDLDENIASWNSLIAVMDDILADSRSHDPADAKCRDFVIAYSDFRDSLMSAPTVTPVLYSRRADGWTSTPVISWEALREAVRT